MSKRPKVRKMYVPGRISPFQVAWNVDKQRYSSFFKTEKERDDYVAELMPYFSDDRSDILKLDTPTIGDIITVNNKRGSVSFLELWKFYEKHHKSREVLTLAQGADVYIRSLRIDNMDESYIVHARRMMEMLVASYGDMLLDDIKRVDLENWIDELPYSPVTKKNYRSTLRAAWTFFERREWIETNIAVRLKCPKIIRGEIGIFTVEEAELLLRANEKVDKEICGLLSLGLFAGMRTSAIARVEYI